MRKLILGLVIGAVLASTAVAVASIPDSSGVIHGCRAIKGGALRVIDTDAGQSCDSRTEVALSWNQTGPQGPAGPAGADGTDGVSGYELVVNDVPFHTGAMQKFTASCPAGKTALGGSFAASSGMTWDPSLIGGYGVPVTELTPTAFNAWTQGSDVSWSTAHIEVTCATTS